MCRGLTFMFNTRIASGHNGLHCLPPPAIVCILYLHSRSKDGRKKLISKKKLQIKKIARISCNLLAKNQSYRF